MDIDDFYEEISYEPRCISNYEMEEIFLPSEKTFNKSSLEDILDNIDEAFSEKLLRLIGPSRIILLDYREFILCYSIKNKINI